MTRLMALPDTGYLDSLPPVRKVTCTEGHQLVEIIEGAEPVVLSGLVSHWPLVKAAGAQQLEAYLARFDTGVDIVAFELSAESKGQVFYNSEMTGFNFSRQTSTLLHVLAGLQDPHTETTTYVGSTPVDYCLPGLKLENDLPIAHLKPVVSLWLGGQTRIAAHFDQPDNIACVVAGRRRFTLFPPDQLENLYIGPWDFNPAGQAISLVDFSAPDYQRFPKFETALASAQVATLEAGDALFIPSMWWHHVESLSSVNALINFWWRQGPAYQGLPVDVFQHALLNLKHLPVEQRRAWFQIFKHYVFNEDDKTLAHIPSACQGFLGSIDDDMARQLRALLRNKLNR